MDVSKSVVGFWHKFSLSLISDRDVGVQKVKPVGTYLTKAKDMLSRKGLVVHFITNNFYYEINLEIEKKYRLFL